MAVLTLKCKVCQLNFPSGVQMDEESFKTADLNNNTEQCPNGHSETYQKDDYFFAE